MKESRREIYANNQKAWVKKNNIRIGSSLTVEYGLTDEIQKAWEIPYHYNMNFSFGGTLGGTYKVADIKDYGIYLSVDEHLDLQIYPYTALIPSINIEDITKAEMQFIGYEYGVKGYSITDLVSSMGLTLQEWKYFKENVFLLSELGTPFISSVISEIDEYFKKLDN